MPNLCCVTIKIRDWNFLVEIVQLPASKSFRCSWQKQYLNKMLCLWQVYTHWTLGCPASSHISKTKSRETYEVTNGIIHFILLHFYHVIQILLSSNTVHPTPSQWVTPLMCDIRQLLPIEVGTYPSFQVGTPTSSEGGWKCSSIWWEHSKQYTC